MSKITIQKSAPTKFPFLSYLLVAFGLFLVQMGYGQASLTQFTNDDFNKGYSNHLVVKNNHVETPYKATSMGSWTSTEALPKALQNHQAVYWNNLTFVTGGIEVVGFQEGVEVREFSNTVYSATVNNGLTNWNELNDLPDSISEHASVVANGYLYVIGGIASDSAASDVVYYAKIRADGTIRDWQTNATALPVAMWGHTATFVDGYIVLTGGSHTADTSATSNVYTVLVEPTGELSNFTAQTSLNINRNQHAAVAYGNRIYVMGGFDETGALSSSVVYADMSISGGITSWTAGTSLPEALYGIAASAHNGTMIVSGGYNDNAGYSVQYSYSADLTAGSAFTWQKSGLYFEHIANASSISIDGKLYVMGGLDIFNNTRSETYYNNLNLSATAKIPNGSFLGEVFDLGLDRSVDTLHYAGDSLYNYAFYYRTAADGASWSSWMESTTEDTIALNTSLRYIQYRFSVNGAAADNLIALDTVLTTFAATQLAGVISTNQTWTLANSPYWVTDDVTLAGGATINIEAGVALTFAEGTKLEVQNAYLNANGTSGNEVIFTSFSGEDGYWNGLHFASSSNAYASNLDYTIVENAGFLGYANLNCNETSQPTINNGAIQNGTNRALYLFGSNPTFNNVTFSNNKGRLIEVEAGGTGYFETPVFINNEDEKIFVIGGTLNSDVFWANIGLEYIINGSLTLYRRLTLDKGLTLQFAENTGISIDAQVYYSRYGELYAEGANHPDSVITFTSLNGEVGGWNGLYFYASSSGRTSILKHCIIENGKEYNVFSNSYNDLSIEHSDITNSLGVGVKTRSTTMTFKNTTFYNNTNDGLHGEYNSNINLDSCLFYQNGGDGFQCNGNFTLLNSDMYENNEAGVHITGGSPQIENVVVQDNGTYGVWVKDSDPDFVNVDVLNNPDHGFLMNANVWPEYYDLVLSGNLTNDFRVNGGQINHEITWEVGQYPFIVIGSFSVASRLTLEKGLTLMFAENTGMTVDAYEYYGRYGELWAEGSNHPDSLITFTSLNGEIGGWNGLYFYQQAAGVNSYLTNCIVENGNDYNIYSNYYNSLFIKECEITNALNNGIKTRSSNITVENSIIYNNGEDGYRGEYNSNILIDSCEFYQNGGDGFEGNGDFTLLNSEIYNNDGAGLHITGKSPQIENVLIQDNGSYGIWVTDADPDFVNVDVFNHPDHGFLMNANVWPEYFDLDLSGNLTNDFRINGGTINHDITWEVGEYPFIVIGSFATTRRLTLEKGFVLKFAENTGMTINAYDYYSNTGELWAIGANHPDSMITFTSLNGEMGGWNGLYFYQTTEDRQSYLTNCIIENGNGYNIYSNLSNQPVIDSSIITQSLNYGIKTRYSSPFIMNSQIINNQSYGFYNENSNGSIPILGDTIGMGNDIFDNGEYDIFNNTGYDILAKHNYFGTTDSVLIHERIYDNNDNALKGYVLIDTVATESINLFGQNIRSTVLYNNIDSTVLDNVKVYLVDDVNDTLTDVRSNNEGTATFLSLMDGNYTLDAATDKIWGSVNATDALLVMQHFASIITLDGVRLKAADVNASATVNSTDALAIMQRFAHITDGFAAGDWTFLAQDETITIAGDNASTILWGLCYGDVNGSNPMSSSKVYENSIQMLEKGQLMVEGSSVELPLYLNSKDLIGAVSLNIAYPENRMQINNVRVNNSNQNVVFRAQNGMLSIAWADVSALNVNADQALLYIDFEITDDALYEEGLNLGIAGYSELANANAMAIADVVISYPSLSESTVGVSSFNDLQFASKISPNPFKTASVFAYSLPEQGNVVCKIYDAQGKVLKELINTTQAAGSYQLTIDGSDLERGIYVVQLEVVGSSQNHSAALKLTKF